jgi:erythronate-4-phosphate dehydrogenase
MIKIVADNRIPFLKGALDKVARVVYLPAKSITIEHLIDADALIVRTRTKCNENLLHGTSVRFIASATIGYDHIDTAYCEANGIRWTNAPGCNSASVKQYIASALAEIIRVDGKSFKNLTLGIIGVGNVGSKVEALAKTLGIKVLVNDPPLERNEGKKDFVSLDILLAESDIVTMHVPLNYHGMDKTFQMVNEKFFSTMKKATWFINTSRGEVIETQSLINVLKSGHLAGAVIDVWENEPEINTELLNLAHIATPHIAGYSADGKANGTAMSVQAISSFFDLGIDNWYPGFDPMPAKSLINLSCRSKSNEEIFCELSTIAYNIQEDTRKLKEFPSTFEMQRENYPIRREPEHLKIVLNDECKNVAQFLHGLGYKI